MESLPTSVYAAIGFLLVMNLAGIGSVIFATIKLIWWLSKLDSRVNENKALALKSHKRLDEFKAEMKREIKIIKGEI